MSGLRRPFICSNGVREIRRISRCSPWSVARRLIGRAKVPLARRTADALGVLDAHRTLAILIQGADAGTTDPLATAIASPRLEKRVAPGRHRLELSVKRIGRVWRIGQPQVIEDPFAPYHFFEGIGLPHMMHVVIA